MGYHLMTVYLVRVHYVVSWDDCVHGASVSCAIMG